MLVKKIFNNNVVLGTDEHGGETVFLGRGLGFQVKPGDVVDAGRVERRFVAQAMPAERLAALAAEIPLGVIEVMEEVVATARVRLGEKISEHILLPLADHVHVALARARTGAVIEYPLKWEIENLYPAETEMGTAALEIIERRLGVRLDETEALPLALHFVNAQIGSGDIAATMQMTQWLRIALQTIGEDLGVAIDQRSLDAARFLTHLRYLFLRARDGKQAADVGDRIGEAVRSTRPLEYACAERLARRMEELFDWRVGREEILYLALHVSRLTAQRDPSEGDRVDA
ncbi:PRD domain-containing protein [Streptomyces caniscabiei]|uniref:PRD domain-containing protein n=1 Tax=Streptomyces caniscabiei TaxID=2746961 RepID=UPI0029B053C5|nr:PRD domain-containing protein [Streptomyces caniscabiei]MDX2599960.1 PRD domain-containing protein [Streptomyces caniscabiei]MDX2734747.1 PRD domain-containing protein [Streptomyces caniscabiei]MDX2779421.1 PRD domain-containing protein [Streptomyces caniscabiei]